METGAGRRLLIDGAVAAVVLLLGLGELSGVIAETGQMPGGACGREGAGHGEQGHGLAAEDLGRTHVLASLAGRHAELHVRKLFAYFDHSWVSLWLRPM